MNVDENWSDDEEGDIVEQGTGNETNTSASASNETNQDTDVQTEEVGTSAQNNGRGVIDRQGLKRKSQVSLSTITDRPKIARLGFPFVIRDDSFLEEDMCMLNGTRRAGVVRPLSATWQRIMRTHEVNPLNSPPGFSPITTAPSNRNVHPNEDDDDTGSSEDDGPVEEDDEGEGIGVMDDEGEGVGVVEDEGEGFILINDQLQAEDIEDEFDFDFEEFGDGDAHNLNVEVNVNENAVRNELDLMDDFLPPEFGAALAQNVNNLLGNLQNLRPPPNAGPAGAMLNHMNHVMNHLGNLRPPPNAGTAGAGVNVPNPPGNPGAPSGHRVVGHNVNVPINNEQVRGILRQIHRAFRDAFDGRRRLRRRRHRR